MPVDRDTMWLECTSQKSPPGYIANFTDDRHVLMITDSGGFLIKTKAYPAGVSRQDRKALVAKGDDMNMPATISTTYTGSQFDYVLRLIDQSAEEQKKALLEDIDIPEFQLNDFSITSEYREHEPLGRVNLDLTLNRYVKMSGDRIFLPLNLMNRNTSVPKELTARKNDVYFSFAYCDTDSIEFEIPDGYAIEFLPEKVSLDYPFGNYTAEVTGDSGRILYVRSISHKKGIYPKETYPDVVEFYRQVVKADLCKALLKKKP